MFFKKYNRASKAVTQLTSSQIVENYARRLEEAKCIPDPVKQVSALEELRDEIFASMDSGNAAIKELARRRGSLAFNGTAVVSIGAMVAFFPAAPLIASFIPVLASEVAQGSTRVVAEDKLRQKSGDFFEALGGQKRLVEQELETVVNSHVETLGKSPDIETMFGRFPDLKARFADAAARKIKSGTTPPQPPKRGFNL